MVVVTGEAQSALPIQMPVARSEERPAGDVDTEVIDAQTAGRNRSRHHAGTAGVGADGDLLVLRKVTRAAGSVVHGLVKDGMATAAMTLPTCDPLASVRPT